MAFISAFFLIGRVFFSEMKCRRAVLCFSSFSDEFLDMEKMGLKSICYVVRLLYVDGWVDAGDILRDAG